MDEVLRQAIPLALSANTLVLTWLVGNRRTAGWVLGCIGQVMWFVFIVTWQVWGLLPLAIGLSFVYARNLVRWRREKRAETAEFVAELAPCETCRDRGADAPLEKHAKDGRVYLDASGPGEPKVIHGEDHIREAMARVWEGRGQVYVIDLRAMAASLHEGGHPHSAEECDLCQQARTDRGQSDES
jgi:hypothetical protein